MSKKNKISLVQIIKAEKPFRDSAIIEKKLKKSPFSQPIQRLARNAEIANKKTTTTLKYYWLDNEFISDSEASENNSLVLGTIKLQKKSKATKKKATTRNKNKTPKATKQALKPKKAEDVQIKPKTSAEKTKVSNSKTKTPAKETKTAIKKIKGSTSKSKTTSKKTKPAIKSTQIADNRIKAQKKNPESTDKKSKTHIKATRLSAKEKVSFSNNQTSKLSSYTNWLNEKTNYKIPVEIVAKKKKPKKKKKSEVKISSNIQSKIDSSLKSKEEIATVALAKLYAKQGFIKKAIRTYEMLSLINPEKSSFFAPLIQELKKQL